MVDIEGGIQPKILPRLKPWLRAGYYYGSGDGDAGDRKHGTFFQIRRRRGRSRDSRSST
ncbi:MAG: hypothetical protein ACRD8O_11720 [Bryobacteraceae bacterium]